MYRLSSKHVKKALPNSSFHLSSRHYQHQRKEDITTDTTKMKNVTRKYNYLNILNNGEQRIPLIWKLWNAQIPRKTHSQNCYKRNHKYSSMYWLNKLNLQFQASPFKKNDKLGWDDFTIKSSKHLKKSSNLHKLLQRILREVTSQLILQSQQNHDTKAWEANYKKGKMQVNFSCEYKCKKS